MTHRDFYARIRDCFQESNDPNERELATIATQFISALDANNAKKRAKQQEKAATRQAERAPLRDALIAALTHEPQTATMLVEAAHLEETTKPTSVPALMRPLIEAGLVEKTEIKVKGKAPYRAYKLA